MTTITLTLPERTIEQAQSAAAALQRPTEEVLRDLLVAVLLTNLEYLEELEGNIFEGLPRNLQRQIEDQTEFNLYIIEPETPTVVKFMIFSRVNTDGLVLTQPVGRQAYRPAPLHPSH